MSAVCDFRDEFDRQVRALDAKVNSFCIADGEHYARIVREVTEAKCRARKLPLDYRRLKRYDVTTATTDDDKGLPPLLVSPTDDGEGTTTTADGTGGRPRRRQYLHNGQLFDALRTSHLDTGHGGLHKMHVDLKRRYANVTRPVVQIFLANCETCRRRRRRWRRGVRRVGGCDRETVQLPLMERARVDLIDGSCGGGEGLIMVYQDCRTKFVVLRALAASPASPAEACDRLTEVFCLFGAPAVLCFARRFDRTFRDRLTDACAAAWPRLRVVWTDDGPSLSDVLESWRHDGSLSSCQYRYNNVFHPDVGRSPFRALFSGGGGVDDDDDVQNAAADPAKPTVLPDDAVARSHTPPDSRRRSVITRAPAASAVAPVPTESAADTTLRMAAAARDETTTCHDNGENGAFSDRIDDGAKKSVRKQCRPAKRVKADVVVGAKRL